MQTFRFLGQLPPDLAKLIHRLVFADVLCALLEKVHPVQDETLPELVMLWHCSFYDHPLDGVATYRGQPVWFNVIEDGGCEGIDSLPADQSTLSRYEIASIHEEEEGYWFKDSIYAIHALTDHQFAELEARHNEFCRAYGYHTDHRQARRQRQKEERDEFHWSMSSSNRDALLSGERLGTFRWFEFTNWSRYD